jgi:hypothetical protein
LARFEFESEIVLFCFSFTFVSFRESCLLVSWCAGAAWRVVTRIVAGIGDLVQRTRDDCTDRVLGNRAIERSGGVVCGLHRVCRDEECRFLGGASKPKSMVL